MYGLHPPHRFLQLLSFPLTPTPPHVALLSHSLFFFHVSTHPRLLNYSSGEFKFLNGAQNFEGTNRFDELNLQELQIGRSFMAMDTEIPPANFTYMNTTFGGRTNHDDSSSAFSDCNSDRSGEFPTVSAQSRQLWLSCAAGDGNFSDELIRQLIADLDSSSIDEQKQAAMEIRLLAKNRPENRVTIAKAGAIGPLISLISSFDLHLQEYGVTAILNLSLCDEIKDVIVDCGAIKPLVGALRTGTATTKENAACALLRISQIEESKVEIGRSGAIPLLVNLLECGGIRGKKDASTALYSLCTVMENKLRAVQAGIMKPLIELMADFGSNMVDKSAYVLSLLASIPEARAALVEEGGIPVLVELVEVGSLRQKEIAAAILLQLCEDSVLHRALVAREGAIPPLVALSQSGTTRAMKKAETLIELLRQPRSGNPAACTNI